MWMRALLVVLLWLVPATAAAQSIDLELIQDVARAKAEEGLALYAEKKWAEAYERFRIAEELFHAPTLVLHMAHCKRELGELRAAKALYEKVAAEELPDDAPPAFEQATGDASEHAATLEQAIPRITIEVSGVPSDQVTVTLDGRALTSLANVEVDPGEHRILATAPGVEGQSRDVELAEGARKTIAIELVPPPPPPPPLPPPPPPEPEPGSLVPAFIAYGVGAAGLIAGAVAGGIAISRVNAIKAECEGDICPDRLVEDAAQAQLAATVSNVGFIVGGVGAIVGTVLVFVRPGGGEEVALELGPGRAALRWTF